MVGEAQVPTGVIPHLTIRDGRAVEAIDFYARAFGAVEVNRSPGPDGMRLFHALLECNGGTVILHDDFPEMRGGVPAPAPTGVVLHLPVADADSAWDRAVAAGATVRCALAD